MSSGTIPDGIITVDANVVKYYFQYKQSGSIPPGVNVTRIEDFSNDILPTYPIAVNKYIRAELNGVIGPALAKNWINIRRRSTPPLAIEVDCKPLDNAVSLKLRDDYCFDIRSRDHRYLETCYRTVFKHLVTENRHHFFRQHRDRRRRSMRAFLLRSIGMTICSIDECCYELA